MKIIRQVLVVGSQVLFVGWVLLFTFFVFAGSADVPDKKWFNKLPIWVLLLINIASLLTLAFIIWVIVQLVV